MKNSFFSKALVLIFLFGGFSTNAQVRVKTNRIYNNKKDLTTKRSNLYNKRVRVKNNSSRIVFSKPNRPKVILNRPNFNRHGYIWINGCWKWNTFYGRYTWQKARWVKLKRNHFWVPGFWKINLGGFFWVKGYWQLEG